MFPCKAMCDPAVFLRIAWISLDVKVLRTARTTVLAKFCNTVTRQPIELGSCSNPLQIQQVFWYRLNFFSFWVRGFLWVKSWLGHVFTFVCLHGPGRQPNRPFFGSIFFLESRLSSESLEPLIGLLTYLEAKLWLKIQKLIKIYPTNTNLGCIPPKAITQQPIELESWSNPLKMRKVFLVAMKKT